MEKGFRKWNKVVLLGMFGMVFAFGIPESSVFADEIEDTVFGMPRYDYRFSNGSPDWDTFYRRCNQFAGQYRYYAIRVDDDFGSDRVNVLRQFVQAGGNNRRFLFANDGVMVTMWFFNGSLGGLNNARHFTNYTEALRYWKDVVQTMR
jgi:hypothetical protein